MRLPRKPPRAFWALWSRFCWRRTMYCQIRDWARWRRAGKKSWRKLSRRWRARRCVCGKRKRKREREERWWLLRRRCFGASLKTWHGGPGKS